MNQLKKEPIATLVIIAVCTLVTIVLRVFPVGNQSESAIFYGAYYKPLILAGEWYRLFTVGFVHIAWIHLLSNMASLYFLGLTLEKHLGILKYLAILFASVIGGSIMLLANGGNTVAVGISGGLYGLLACCVILMLRTGTLQRKEYRSSFLRNVAINLLINFIPGVAWRAHLGGFLVGWIVSALLLKDTSPFMKKRYAIAGVALVVTLAAFCYQNRVINDDELYLGTDMKILSAYEEIGLKNHALKMAENLDRLYNTDILVAELQKD